MGHELLVVIKPMEQVMTSVLYKAKYNKLENIQSKNNFMTRVPFMCLYTIMMENVFLTGSWPKFFKTLTLDCLLRIVYLNERLGQAWKSNPHVSVGNLF